MWCVVVGGVSCAMHSVCTPVWCSMVCVLCVVCGMRWCAELCGGFRRGKINGREVREERGGKGCNKHDVDPFMRVANDAS